MNRIAKIFRSGVWVVAVLAGFAVQTQAAPGGPPKDPILRLNPEGHGGVINRIAVGDDDALYTVSDDKTLRKWSMRDGRLMATLRPPIGMADEGALYAIALSPKIVAVAGRTGVAWNKSSSVYLFSRSKDVMAGSVAGFNGIVTALSFSRSGRYLAIGLDGPGGLQVLDLKSGKIIHKDTSLGGAMTWVEFLGDDHLVAATANGGLALYKRFEKVASTELGKGIQPYSARFSPDGQTLAVGIRSHAEVLLLDVPTLTLRNSLKGENGVGGLSAVSWSRDGKRIVAGGFYRNAGNRRLIASWSYPSLEPLRVVAVADDTIMDIAALPDGGFAFATAEPGWGHISSDLAVRLKKDSPIADFRDIGGALAVSENGEVVDFALQQQGQTPIRFSLPRRALSVPDGTITRPATQQSGRGRLEDWRNSRTPRFNGASIALEDGERSLAARLLPGHAKALIGTNFYLRMVGDRGQTLWSKVVPAAVWGVASSGDGKLAVAALGDGTVRWYDTTNGDEKLALYVHRDAKRWIAWTPEGYFDHNAPVPPLRSPTDLVGYHINDNANKSGAFVAAGQLYDRFYRKDLVARSLSDAPSPQQAHGQESREVVQAVLSKGLPPKLRLLELCEVAGNGQAQNCRSGNALQKLLQSGTSVSSASEELRLRVEAVDRGAGIGKVRLHRSGVYVDSRASVVSNGKSKREEMHWVRLAPRENAVRLTALGLNGVTGGENDEVKVDVFFEPPPQSASGRVLYVVAVGVDDYQNIPPLDNAGSDAKAIAKLMSDVQGALFTRVEEYLLVDGQATESKLSATLSEIAGKARPEDMLMLFLAGHGEAVNGRYYFAPVDMGRGFSAEIQKAGSLSPEGQKALLTKIYRAEGLSQDRLIDMLGAIQASHSVMLIDTCYSGAVVNDTWVNVLAENTGRFVMAASTAKQVALDGGEGAGDGNQHGLFTEKVLEALGGKADWDQDRIVDVSELAKYAKREVPRAARSMGEEAQEPTYYIGSKELFGVRAISGDNRPL